MEMGKRTPETRYRDLSDEQIVEELVSYVLMGTLGEVFGDFSCLASLQVDGRVRVLVGSKLRQMVKSRSVDMHTADTNPKEISLRYRGIIDAIAKAQSTVPSMGSAALRF